MLQEPAKPADNQELAKPLTIANPVKSSGDLERPQPLNAQDSNIQPAQPEMAQDESADESPTLRRSNETRHLDMPDTGTYKPVRATTGPLEEALPWVIEFRVVGTASTIQAQVHEAMIIGRTDTQRGIFPTVDLENYGGRNGGVSRQHAVIIVKDNRIKIRDLGSVNGTRLNGLLLAPHQDYRLRHGDELEIGQVKLQVRFAVVPTIDEPVGDSTVDRAVLPVVGHNEHVLIVEDDADVAKVFSMALEHTGFRASITDSAASALAFVTKEMPDLIVLDLMLPDMNGLDLVRYVRKQESGKDVPMVVCSGATGGFQMSQAKEAGANMFLGKPVTVNELIKTIASVLKPAVPLTSPKPTTGLAAT
jgi:CheY-like chemotaxis protein